MNRLILYTLSFPYGTSEQSFLIPELEKLTSRFDKIYLVPLNKGGTKTKLASNIEVLDIAEIPPYFDGWLFLKNFLRLFSADIRRHPLLLMRSFWSYLRSVKHLTIRQKQLNQLLERSLGNDGFTVHYSYWLSDWASILALSNKLEGKLRVSRAHGFDLYDERSKYGFQLFRQAQLQSLDAVFVISSIGKEYLQKRFPRFSQKIKLARLGSPSIEFPKVEFDADCYRIHSCSSLIPLKRVNLIIETLSHCKTNIYWTHAGTGPLSTELKQKAQELPKNIRFEFLGQLTWAEIQNIYSSQAIDLFLHLSESEGIPVAIMEALSVGIPVMACDVGGVSEVIPESELLLSPSVEPLQLAVQIDQFLKEGASRNKTLRQMHLKFWQEHFAADTNFSLFTEELYSLTIKP